MKIAIALVACALTGCEVTQTLELDHDTRKADAECRAALSNPALDPIRDKVTLFRSVSDPPPSYSATANTSIPNDAESAAIALWLSLRADCARRQDAATRVPKAASPRFVELLGEEIAGFRGVRSGMDSYVALLGAGKVSYGEFEVRHYQLIQQVRGLQSQLRHGYLNHSQPEMKDAKARFTTLLKDWDSYLDSLARVHSAAVTKDTST